MHKHLIKLADILDQNGLSHYVNVVDYLISKSGQQNDFGEFASDVLYDEQAAKGNVTIPKVNATLNVFQHPLGVMVRTYCEMLADAFVQDQEKRTGANVSVKDIDALVDEFKKYNNDLSLSEVHWKENDNLIYPDTVRDIVKHVGSFVYHNSPFNIEAESYIDFVDHIHEIYVDFYSEDFLGSEGFDYREHGRKMDQWRAENPDYMNENAEALLFMHDMRTKKQEDMRKKHQQPASTQEVMKQLQEGDIDHDAPTVSYDDQ